MFVEEELWTAKHEGDLYWLSVVWIMSWEKIRATSHMSQELWPSNGEDPWLSSKGCTMGVGKAVLCIHGPSSIVWSENGSCCETVACFVGGNKGQDLAQYNIISLKLYQFKSITWWCLSILEFGMWFVLLERYKKKSWSPGICVKPTSWRWAWQKFIQGDHETLSIVRHVGLHVDFSSHEVLFGPSPSCVKQT